jgi:photoactive yellow protein
MSETATSADGFVSITLARLDALSVEQVDLLPYGVIGFNADCLVEVYNKAESRLAGLSADSVLGVHFFLSTAQCMNNFMVAQRFEDEPELDAIIDFVLTLRMRPTAARLRLLQGAAAARRYILVER